MRGCAGRRSVRQQVADDPARLVDRQPGEVAGVQALEQHGEAGRVGPHEADGAVAVPRLQGEGLRRRLGVRPGHLEHALAADPDGLATGAEQAHGDDDGADPVHALADRLELPLVQQAGRAGRAGRRASPAPDIQPCGSKPGDLVGEERRHEVVARGPPARRRSRRSRRGPREGGERHTPVDGERLHAAAPPSRVVESGAVGSSAGDLDGGVDRGAEQVGREALRGRGGRDGEGERPAAGGRGRGPRHGEVEAAQRVERLERARAARARRLRGDDLEAVDEGRASGR